MESKNVYDSIHKLINFDTFTWRIIDTPQFQRLRHLHQLGSNYFVFPSANHSRFEHSLGTGYLSLDLLNNLKLNDADNEIEITHQIKRGVSIAGLCHNLGHGPFSYPFTDFVNENIITSSIIKPWSDLEATIMLLDNLIDTNSIDLSKEEINMIKNIIMGENFHAVNFNLSSPWILQIVNNKTNAVDVHKIDFLMRDSYKLGIFNQSLDTDILIKNARIINNKICYRAKDAFGIYELFQCRYRLFKEFYLHRVAKGIDLMIKDIFSEANSVYEFKNYLYDPEMYIKLKDSILNEIFYSKNISLSKSKELVNRIYKRDLYKFVGEKTCLPSSKQYEKFLNLSEDDIINCADSDGVEFHDTLRRGDIKIMKFKLDFCKGEEDPVKYVSFYKKNNSTMKIVDIDKSDVSLLVPNNFFEIIVRIYVTSKDKLSAAKNAFLKFCEINGELPHQYEKKSGNKLDRSVYIV